MATETKGTIRLDREPTHEELERLLTELARRALDAVGAQPGAPGAADRLLLQGEAQAYTHAHALLAKLLGWEIGGSRD